MASWMQISVGDLGDLFDGPHATPERTSDGPYFLNIASLKSGRLDLSESDHLNRQDFKVWTRRVTPRCDDLLFSYETRLGEAALMPAGVEACLGRRMALLRPNPAVVNPRFLLYFYLSPVFQRTIAKHTVHGATVPRIGLSMMPGWSVKLPGLTEQRAIAEVLGALDDKIAANERVIRCAGEVADAEFARFRQVAKTIQRTFAEVAEVGGGGTPRTSVAEYWGESIPWATPTDVTGLAAPYLHQTSRSITDEGLAACSSSLYPIGSILMTSRATIGAFAIAQVPVAVNQGFIVVNAKDPELQWWIYHDMRSRVDEFLAHSNGATFLELPRGKFKQLPVQAPGLDAALRFSEVVGPLHGVATARLVENARLAATRDELLPLLMSGRLHVKDAEKVVAEVV
jgi:type I restriction enzyme, S subunit